MGDGPFQEDGHPILVPLSGGEGRIGTVAAVHGEQMTDRHGAEGVGGILRDLVREKVHDLVLKGQSALGDGKPHGRGREGLAHRVHDMGAVRLSFAHPLLLQHLSVLEDHDAVDVLAGFVLGLEIGRKGGIQFRRSLFPRQLVVTAAAGHQDQRGQTVDNEKIPHKPSHCNPDSAPGSCSPQSRPAGKEGVRLVRPSSRRDSSRWEYRSPPSYTWHCR